MLSPTGRVTVQAAALGANARKANTTASPVRPTMSPTYPGLTGLGIRVIHVRSRAPMSSGLTRRAVLKAGVLGGLSAAASPLDLDAVIARATAASAAGCGRLQ